MTSAAGIEERLGSLEKKLKELMKEKKPQDDPEVVRTRKSISDHLCDLVRVQQADEDATVERLWKLCFNKRIDEYRRRIAATATGTAKRKITAEFKQYLGDCARFFEDLLQLISPSKKPRTAARISLSLGDIARYRELVSDTEEKRWTEATQWYRHAVEYWPQSGAAHNQLAVVASYQGRSIISVYRYERALACAKPFEVSRNNLKEMLSKIDNEPFDEKVKARHEILLSKWMRIHAFVLLPDSKRDRASLDADLRFLSEELSEMVQSKSVRGEVRVALLLSSAFAVCKGDVCGIVQPDVLKTDVAMRCFRAVAQVYVDQSCLDSRMITETLQQQGGSLTQDQEDRLHKSLLFPSLVGDFVTAQGRTILDSTLKSAFEILDQLLSLVPVENDAVVRMEELDEEEQEYAGFQTLGAVYAESGYNEVKKISTLARRVFKVRSFIRRFVEQELTVFSADGRLLSTRPPSRIANNNDDDMEEEILFRPAFAGPPTTRSVAVPPQVPLPVISAPTTTQMQAESSRMIPNSVPAFYPFASGAFGNGAWNSAQLGPNGAASTWDASAFRWGVPNPSQAPFIARTATPNAPVLLPTVEGLISRPPSRPPPGFNQ